VSADRRESTLEVQRRLLEWCDEVHLSAQVARLTAGITHQDAAEVRTHCADVRAAVARGRSVRWAEITGPEAILPSLLG
jgi:hypothetical protein